ncbi:heterokaryon incompatibility protein-domain-containing protein [Pisolithus orientalis]|uniref:heterokaryon incompatibility protein-domain-containing protein n=1 Tax=Pisolithus orientalis TaxID=936130 RepID=UPI0022241229|nr:heterokaryon incompatibility protein-domain-containing protein [Pisolithus orientalis]KAI5987757.1 heterokaryon incompatibility protein-domain-containing protein [Pisolithus orientalis]
MRLLEIKAIIDWDKDVKEATFQTQVLEERDDAVTSYAILSHRWQDGHEVDYNEMTNLMKMDEEERKKVKQRNGYKKILASCEQAMRDGFEWLWVDTCCIDKRSSSELSEAINSMYRWYENSTKCYAYLHDVDSTTFPTKQNSGRFSKCKGWPEWFSRGWTLQELIAPRVVQFFNKEWAPIGNKRDLADTLEKITCISKNILISGMDSGVRSAAQIMSWAADRETTRAEDRAYSLLGLFGVHMPMMYGEGKGAFQRLQLEIIRLYNDHSLFAWDPEGRMRRCGSILADDPSYFRDCDGIWSMEPKWFVSQLKSHMRDRSAGVVGKVMPANLMNFTFLTVRGHALIKELSTCSVGSGGLQISLPIAPYPSSNSSPPLFRATLACVASLAGPLMTIDLVSDSTRYYRFFGATGELTTFPRVKQVFLSYCQGELRSRRTLILDDGTVSFYGFTRCGTFPSGIVGNSVKLSGMNDLIVVIYANDKADVRFAVGFGYYLGNPWTHVIYDESRLTPWKDYAKKAYGSLSTSQADLARNTSDYDVTTSDTASFIKHAHLPRSIWAARTTWGVWNRGNCTVIIDIVVCTGCCRGPLALKTSTADWSGVENPGFMQQALSTPRVWCRDAIDDKRRTQFKEIRWGLFNCC